MGTATLRVTTALAAVLACSSAVPQDDPQLSLTVELKPGPPVGTPLQDASDVAPQSTFRQGYPIAAVFTITNVGDEMQELVAMKRDRGEGTGDYAVEVVDSQGEAVPDPFGWAYRGAGGLVGPIRLSPGDSDIHAIYLNHWVRPLPPGTYHVVGTVCTIDTRDHELHTTHLRSEPVGFDIAPTSGPEMAKYIDDLAAELASEDEAHLEQTVKHLAYTGHELAVPRVVGALYNRDLRRTLVVLGAFCYLDPDASKAALLEALKYRGPTSMGGYFLRRLYDVPEAEMVDAVLAGLEHADLDRRADAARELRDYTEFEDEVIGALLRALDDPEPQVRSAAALSLAPFADPRIETALLTTSRDPDAGTRRCAVAGLKTRPSDESLARLREMALDEPDVAEAAIEALRDIGTPEAVDALRTGLENSDEETRLKAAIALLRSGDDGVRPLLAEALDTADLRLSGFLTSFLSEAIWTRGIPGPGEDGKAYCSDAKRWLEWLRPAE